MSTLAEEFKEMDFEFFATGEYGMSMDEAMKVIGNDHFLFLDVRTNEEAAYASFPFATHIPLNELPERLGELPKDKFIVPFCASVFRAALAYGFLLTQGYPEVKGLTATTDQIALVMKPGPLYKIVK